MVSSADSAEALAWLASRVLSAFAALGRAASALMNYISGGCDQEALLSPSFGWGRGEKEGASARVALQR